MAGSGGALDCFFIARSLELGAGKLAPRDGATISSNAICLVSLSLSIPTDSIRAPSSQLIAPSYEEVGTRVLITDH